MSYARVRLYPEGLATDTDLLGFSRSVAGDIDLNRVAGFLIELGYGITEIPAAEVPESADYPSVRYLETQPPLAPEHATALEDWCETELDGSNDGIKFINQKTPGGNLLHQALPLLVER